MEMELAGEGKGSNVPDLIADDLIVDDLILEVEALRAALSDREKREHELTTALEQSEKTRKDQSRLITDITHEMRTPLQSILGQAEIMYDSKQTLTERLHCLGRIRQNVKVLTDLLVNVAELMPLGDAANSLKLVTFSLVPELGDIYAMLHSEAWKKRLHLEFENEGPIPESITSDPRRFRQLIVHLVQNAIKFTERGGVKVTLSLTVNRPGSPRPKLLIAVKDTGKGITREEQGLLFHPEYAHSRDFSLSHPRGGLNLLVARNIAQSLGGDVALVDSKVNAGSTFEISIDPGPLESATWIQELSEKDLLQRMSPLPNFQNHELEGMSVLLVEDAPDSRHLISHFLKKFGATVDVAENGHQAVEKAKTQPFDLILMDLQMPILNGYEATVELQRFGLKSPIIALTAHAEQEVKERCLAAGCSDYLTKPINANAMLQIMQRYHPRNLAAH